MKEKILITSALPYANGPLHFGHIAGAYLPADCYARFERLKKKDVLYICGSDEYGVAITLSAELAKRSPQEHVDLFHEINKNFFSKLEISFDHYSRTTWEGHEETVHQFFKDLLENGYIEAKETHQLYSEEEKRFLADRYIEGECPRCRYLKARGDECPSCGASYEATDLINPRSKLTQSQLTPKPTVHWFLLLDSFKERLNRWIQDKQWKPNVLNFIKDYIDHLHARAITRDSTWGVSLPLSHEGDKVLYVWFDAPIGYISATKEWAKKVGNSHLWKNYWLDAETKLVQFMGKDNITFHASIFPAMVMGQNEPYKLVDELVANEFYKLEGRQFSKSEGWFIDLDQFFKQYTSDQIRYVIAANAPETSDSEFTWKDFQQRCNSELLGKYGNLVNRVLVFLQNQCQGISPVAAVLEEKDKEFLTTIHSLTDETEKSYGEFKIRRATQLIMEIAQAGNSYFDSKQPWKDAKQPESQERMKATIACCLECLKLLALVSFPIIPQASSKILSFLDYSIEDLQMMGWKEFKELPLISKKLPPPEILFQRVEDELIQKELNRLQESLKKTG